MRETQEKSNGITLIALVITIIVLLILAGVTIAMLTGENGILTQSSKATVSQIEANVDERVRLAVQGCKIAIANETARDQSWSAVTDGIKPSDNKLDRASTSGLTNEATNGVILASIAEDLKDTGYFISATTPTGTGTAATRDMVIEYSGDDYKKATNNTNAKIEYTINVTQHEVKIASRQIASGNSESSQGGNDNQGGGSTGGSTIDSASYGDPVSYSVDLDGNTTTNDWKIFYSDSNGTYIIAADYLNNSLLPAATDMGTYNGYPFSAYWPSTSNLTKTTIDSNASKFMNGWSSTTNYNGKAVAALLDTNAWSSFAAGATGAVAIGGPTIELYTASWNEKYTHLYTETNDTGYYVGTVSNLSEVANDWDETKGGYYVDMSSDSGYNDTLYYPHKDTPSNCYGYWLASPSAYSDNYVMYVDYYGSVSRDNYDNIGIGVRPVVFLPSSIQLTENASGVWELK